MLVPGGPPGAEVSEAGGRILFAFDDAARAAEWRVVNDGVMGGLSRGSFRITASGTLQFSGTLSLENNGGFASIRSRPQDLGLEPGDHILVRVRGDGRRYSLNLYVPSRRNAFSYRVPLMTARDEWVEHRVPLEEFRASWFGRSVDEPLEPQFVEAVGFMLSDGNSGPFRLEVDWIRVVGGRVRQ